MVAYSFKSRFVMPIREGWKTQTIRAHRGRHARPGEMIQLFTAMRTRYCERIVGDVRCTLVMPISINFGFFGEITRICTEGIPVRDLAGFAVRDGFVDAMDMAGFWAETHQPGDRFEGVIIEWAAPRAEAAAV